MTLYELKMYIKRIPLARFIWNLIQKEDAEKELSRKRAALKNEGQALTRLIEQTLSGENVEFFVNFGSLLGLVRAGEFMAHDCDVDYGIFINEDFTWADLENVLGKQGFVKIKQFTYQDVITEQTYRLGDLTVDFFGTERDAEHSYINIYFRKEGYIYHSSQEYHVSRLNMYPISGIQEMDFGGTIHHVPNEPEAFLASVYGDDWRIPNPDWTDTDGPGWNELEGAIALVEYFE